MAGDEGKDTIHKIYRQTLMGDCLTEALEELINAGKITEDLALSVLQQFDASMLEALRSHVAGRATMKANLTSYRYYDNVWQFDLSNVQFRLTAGTMGPHDVHCDKAKVVCVDCKLFESAEDAGAAGGAGGAEGAGEDR